MKKKPKPIYKAAYGGALRLAWAVNRLQPAVRQR